MCGHNNNQSRQYVREYEIKHCRAAARHILSQIRLVMTNSSDTSALYNQT